MCTYHILHSARHIAWPSHTKYKLGSHQTRNSRLLNETTISGNIKKTVINILHSPNIEDDLILIFGV